MDSDPLVLILALRQDYSCSEVTGTLHTRQRTRGARVSYYISLTFLLVRRPLKRPGPKRQRGTLTSVLSANFLS
jgi:hypothetical protein